MTAKRYLTDINKYHRICLSLQDQIEDLRNQIGGLKAITYDKDRVQVSPTNHMEEKIPDLIRAEEKYVKALVKYNAEVLKRAKQIADLDRADYSEILRLRYIELDKDGMPLTLEEISCRMHLSFWRTAHLHGEALEAFRRKYLT